MDTSMNQTLRQISPEAFAMLGAPGLAYIRPIETPQGPGFGIFAANGTPIGASLDRDTAFAAARQHDLEPVSVH